MDISNIRPSQLYISKQKLNNIQISLNLANPMLDNPLPIKKLNGRIIFVDGHTRAVAFYLLNQKTVPVYWEYEELDWEMYEVCVQWCIDEKILSVEELSQRIIPHTEYEQLWYKRCDELHASMEKQRSALSQNSKN